MQIINRHQLALLGVTATAAIEKCCCCAQLMNLNDHALCTRQMKMMAFLLFFCFFFALLCFLFWIFWVCHWVKQKETIVFVCVLLLESIPFFDSFYTPWRMESMETGLLFWKAYLCLLGHNSIGNALKQIQNNRINGPSQKKRARSVHSIFYGNTFKWSNTEILMQMSRKRDIQLPI